MRRFILKFFILLFLFFPVAELVFSQNEPEVTLYFFYGRTCSHCAKEKRFLEKLEEEYLFLKVKRFEVTENYENVQLLEKIREKLKINNTGVPFTIVGEQTFAGYYNDQTTGQAIRQAVEKYYQENYCPDIVEDLVCEKEEKKETRISLPFFGEIDARSFSLPLLTIVIAGLDGFNPCAMWVLLFLISLLLGMKDKLKMWLLGGAFIFVSGLVYFLFLSAWLNIFLFLGFVFYIRILIGLVGLGGGVYNFREFLTNREGVCKVTSGNRKQKVFEKLREIVGTEKFILALLGIALLAIAVNLVELVCSAGLPAIYTQVLSISNLAKWQYYLYLFLYILIFMLDDAIVFAVAMVTLNSVGLSGKYSRYLSLINGILIFVLGLLLLFKPEWLMFG